MIGPCCVIPPWTNHEPGKWLGFIVCLFWMIAWDLAYILVCFQKILNFRAWLWFSCFWVDYLFYFFLMQLPHPCQEGWFSSTMDTLNKFVPFWSLKLWGFTWDMFKIKWYGPNEKPAVIVTKRLFFQNFISHVSWW